MHAPLGGVCTAEVSVRRLLALVVLDVRVVLRGGRHRAHFTLGGNLVTKSRSPRAVMLNRANTSQSHTELQAMWLRHQSGAW